MTSEIQVYKLYHDLKNVNSDRERVAIVQAHDDAIRRECADRAMEYGIDNLGKPFFLTGLRAAILATEPARESSRAISFDGFFYVFTDPTTGATKSYSSYKNAAAALDKIIGTELAREES